MRQAQGRGRWRYLTAAVGVAYGCSVRRLVMVARREGVYRPCAPGRGPRKHQGVRAEATAKTFLQGKVQRSARPKVQATSNATVGEAQRGGRRQRELGSAIDGCAECVREPAIVPREGTPGLVMGCEAACRASWTVSGASGSPKEQRTPLWVAPKVVGLVEHSFGRIRLREVRQSSRRGDLGRRHDE